MTVRVSEIASAEWSLKLHDFGNVVTELDDISQCIGIILTTRRGEDPHRPLFGCDAWKYLDAPVSVATPNIIREVVDALELWEPRIDTITAAIAINTERITVRLEWKLKQETTVYTTEVNL